MKKITAILAAILLLGTTFLVSACGEVRLSTPAYCYVDDQDDLYWSEVDDARSYEIEITNSIGEIVTRGSRRATYSLSALDEGDYDIRIRAVGVQGLYSDWSETLSYYKPADYGYLYTRINDGTAWLLSSARSSVGDVVIESTYRGKPVLEIGDGAFRNNQQVTSVVLEEGVQSIGASVFLSCISLTSVSVPESVTSIGEATFQGCTLLKEAYFPDPEDMNVIPDYLYAYCSSIEEIDIPDGVVEIGTSAFSNCIALKEVTIPDSVETIGINAFTRNSELTSVTLGAGLTSIGAYAFLHDPKLETVTFAGPYESLTLGSQCFASCDMLTKMDLPAGTETIPTGCFQYDTALAEVTIPDSVTDVGAGAFVGTALLEGQPKGFAYADKWLISVDQDTLTELTAVGQNIREGTVGIGTRVFATTAATDTTAAAGCPNLVQVDLPASIRYVGSYAFYGCPGLYRFTVPENSDLRVVNLGSKLKSIGDYAFNNCITLDNNTLNPEYLVPASVTHIGAYAFRGTALYNTSGAYGVIYAGNWVVGFDDSRQILAITLRDGVRGVADYCFYDNQNLQMIDGLAQARYIGTAAFMNCQQLTAASLNMNLSAIEDLTFFQCMALSSINFPDSLTRIGDEAFFQCDRLSVVDLSATQVKTIGTQAFFSCAIRDLRLPEGLETIGDLAFYLNGIPTLDIPASATIGVGAFGLNVALQQLTLHEGLKEITNYAFCYCRLGTLEIPESVERIKTGAFLGCGLSEVRFGSNLQEIAMLAFAYNSSLRSVTFPASLKQIGDYAFLGCTILNSVVLPETLETLGRHTFFGCTAVNFYTPLEEAPEGWGINWNSSFRPVFWGAEISEEGYVLSVDTAKLENVTTPTVGGAPYRAGYDFLGWATAEGGAAELMMSDLMTLTEDAVYYAVYAPSESDIPDAE